MNLGAKKVLLAGVASPIGLQIANCLSLLGASLVIVDPDEQSLAAVRKDTQDASVEVHKFDIYDIESIQPNLREVTQKFGPFDGFVFSGGIGGVRPLSFTKHAFLHNMMNANVYVFIEMVRCITRKGSFNFGGSIVAISSVSSIKGLKAKTAYSASKAALDACIKNIAAELSDRRVRVNSILKGWVSSDLGLDFIKNNIDLGTEDDLGRQLLGLIEPEEIANTVAFLLSDATRTITGTNLLLDGGYTL